MGHTISTVRMDDALGWGIYTYIYLFHMPAMILLSGVFSRPETTPRAVRSTFQLLITWALWEGLWAVLRFVFEGDDLSSKFLVSPAWSLWFLVSLATMRILLPYFARLRHPLLCSVLLALAAGASPAIGSEFSASRTLCFMPFFVAGWLARDRGWLAGDWFMRPARRTRAIAWGLLGIVALGFVAVPQLREVWRLDSWLRWRDGYAYMLEDAPLGSLEPSTWWGILLTGAGVRLLLLGIAAAMILALLLVTPRRSGVATAWGARTLYIYLLHGPIIWALRESGAVERISALGGAEGSVLGIAVLLGIGAAITVVLSMRWVTKVFHPLVEPRFEPMFARP
ncbi:acyltransferase family protein [Leucobacter sp. CSA1]|uniref:Acyltransferase family protein n=2 Tax=Leucobacter chromiisoli TaxID=2796471 RepID=A0A934Q6K7_9MICO|nr:acyltransferase family protein [Leucobacter chromiisoli]